MATVYIGGASIDERGKASGGQAGNQSGRELRKQAYYDHAKEWYVFRAGTPPCGRTSPRRWSGRLPTGKSATTSAESDFVETRSKTRALTPRRRPRPARRTARGWCGVCVAYAFERNGLDAGAVPDWYTGTLPKLIMGLGEFEVHGQQTLPGRAVRRAGTSSARAARGTTVVVLNDGDLFDGGGNRRLGAWQAHPARRATAARTWRNCSSGSGRRATTPEKSIMSMANTAGR